MGINFPAGCDDRISSIFREAVLPLGWQVREDVIDYVTRYRDTEHNYSSSTLLDTKHRPRARIITQIKRNYKLLDATTNWCQSTFYQKQICTLDVRFFDEEKGAKIKRFEKSELHKYYLADSMISWAVFMGPRFTCLPTDPKYRGLWDRFGFKYDHTLLNESQDEVLLGASMPDGWKAEYTQKPDFFNTNWHSFRLIDSSNLPRFLILIQNVIDTLTLAQIVKVKFYDEYKGV